MSHEKLSVRPPHPLFGADLRAKRAKVQIAALKRHMQRWTEVKREHLDLALGEDGGIVDFGLKPSLPIAEGLGRTGVWVGEALFNMRSALDYLVYEIACTAAGRIHVKNTQFPICDRQDDFIGQATGQNPRTKKRVTCRLEHVPQSVVDRIEQLQPYNGCQWTRLLRDLSNPQKHHGIGSFSSTAQFLPASHPELKGRVDEDEEGTTSYYFTVQVFFSKPRLDVVDTLEELQRGVSSLVDEFKPAFKPLA